MLETDNIWPLAMLRPSVPDSWNDAGHISADFAIISRERTQTNELEKKWSIFNLGVVSEFVEKTTGLTVTTVTPDCYYNTS